MRFKKGNRWRNNSGQVRYKTWRTNVFKLNKGRLGYQNTMFVKNVVRRERQHEYFTHIIYSLGTNTRIYDIHRRMV